MQFLDEKYPNLFAVGDIADTGTQKAARPGVEQALVVAKNIQALIEGRSAEEKFKGKPAGIHLTLGIVSRTGDMRESRSWNADNGPRNIMSFSAT